MRGLHAAAGVWIALAMSGCFTAQHLGTVGGGWRSQAVRDLDVQEDGSGGCRLVGRYNDRDESSFEVALDEDTTSWLGQGHLEGWICVDGPVVDGRDAVLIERDGGWRHVQVTDALAHSASFIVHDRGADTLALHRSPARGRPRRTGAWDSAEDEMRVIDIPADPSRCRRRAVAPLLVAATPIVLACDIVWMPFWLAMCAGSGISPFTLDITAPFKGVDICR